MTHVRAATEPEFDTIVIGAGHNALVCAAYLARAGQRVGVFERAETLGGASATRELLPGHQFDVGGSTHSFIHLTPIERDLALRAYGLRYIDLDPLFFMPFSDDSSLVMWRSIERTCESIARISPSDADAYRRFCQEWTPIVLTIADLMMTIPTPLRLARALSAGLATKRGWRVQYLPRLRLSIRQFLVATFRSEQVKALLGWLAAQVGVGLDEPGGAVYVIWQVIYHECGISIPRGGSGELAQALARAITAHHGIISVSTEVRRILVEQGQAVGVETASGHRFFARQVVSGAHIKTTARLLDGAMPPRMARRIGQLKTTNGGGVVLRLAVSALPTYRAYADPLTQRAVQLIAPTLDAIAAAGREFAAGLRSTRPLLSALTYSAADSTRSRTISVWAQYYPYRFSDGAAWDAATEAQVASEIVETLEQYAPGVRASILDQRLDSPRTFESELGLIGGDLQHIGVTFDQMFLLRPGLRMSAYRTPIDGLYITGASTHPGGGITGMPGWNAARVILREG